ncbi:MAG TPA: hypothetical protein DEA05_03805 [Rhodobacteraceae bacterium]|jgi:hypothetical protein|nr:hypothetical protein [Paracoccaceae bacterium]
MNCNPPSLPDPVAAALAAHPPFIRAQLLQVRAEIFALARETGTGPLTETLKWGEPAYLTEATKAGTTIRLGRVRRRSGAAVLFNCRTTLIDGLRDQFGDLFQFDGNRALILPEAPDRAALRLCLARALTYHRDKRTARA